MSSPFQLAVERTATATREALLGRGFSAEVADRFVQAVMNEVVSPGVAAAQVQAYGPVREALAYWDGSGEVPAVAAEMVEEIGEAAAGMVEFYGLMAKDPAGYLSAKARALVVFQAEVESAGLKLP